MCGITNVVSLNFKNIFSIFSLSLGSFIPAINMVSFCYIWNNEIMTHLIFYCGKSSESMYCFLRVVSCVVVTALKMLPLELSDYCTIFFEPLYGNLHTKSNG